MLFCLHYLGGSARAWRGVEAGLANSLRCVPLDLPGFGDAAGIAGYAVAEMADQVATRIRAEAPGRWLLAGHSMGAKVAAVLARRAEDGEAGLGGLAGLVLLAGSPPGPEPIEEGQRRAMMGWFGGEARASRREAMEYITQNLGSQDPAEIGHAVLREEAVRDVLRASRDAWLAWLERGSREDWRLRIGVLRTPALLIAGERDAALGPAAQRHLMLPHFARARLEVLPGAGHLLPMERAAAVARLIAAHAAAIEPEAPPPAIGAGYLALIGSDRVSAQTRDALLERARPDPAVWRPRTVAKPHFATLAAVLDRVVPQSGPVRIDLAARIDADLAQAHGDGWRFARLPADREAYGAALRTLDAAAQAETGTGFAQLAGVRQDAILERCAAARLGSDGGTGLLDATQMQLWFEDLRADAVKHYVAHPATLERMSYGGIANGGDAARQSGFSRIGVGEREPWEPGTAAGEIR